MIGLIIFVVVGCLFFIGMLIYLEWDEREFKKSTGMFTWEYMLRGIK